MGDTAEQRTDDAPLATAKHGPKSDANEGSVVASAVTIGRPQQELYAFWRNLPNLATFMENIERIDLIDDRRSHWVVKAPADRTVEWDAIVTEDRAGELIAWASTDGADVANSGRVEFRDAGARGTVVTATIAYDPPAGVVGKLVAKLFQREPAIQARRELRRFKQLMETGEIATAAMNPPQRREETE